MFTVKATYRTETRKFTFNDISNFPSYDDLYLQLYRVFPISHNYYLSKLLFSPDVAKPSRVLLRREVHNAEEYDIAIAPFNGRVWPNALLKFSIFDETPHKVPRSHPQVSHSSRGVLESELGLNARQVRSKEILESVHNVHRASGERAPHRVSSMPGPMRASVDGRPLRVPTDVRRISKALPRVPQPTFGTGIGGTSEDARRSRASLLARVAEREEEDLNRRFKRVMDESVRTMHAASVGTNVTSYPPFPPLFQPSPPVGTPGQNIHLPPPPGVQRNQSPAANFIPPPPIIFSPPQVGGIKDAPPVKVQPSPQPAQTQSTCCAADVRSLMDTFKADLERIVQGSLPCEVHNGIGNCEPPRSEEPAVAAPVSAAPVISPPMTCTTCGEQFVGTEFTTCTVCSWKVICPGCANDNLLARHVDMHDDTHSFIKKARQDLEGQQAGADADNHTSTSVQISADVARHVGVVCDRCNKTPIEGVRHKCLDCRDFDLCGDCITDGGAEQHNPFHEFFAINEPGRVVVHTVFSGNGERTPAASTPRAPSVVPEPVVVPPIVAAAPAPQAVITHNATCDLCDSKIRGDRYKCLNCPDFDTCHNCYAITAEQHPSHGFVKVSNPSEIQLRGSLVPGKRHYATCDACKKVIRGVRYKCMHSSCADFDLCSNCEAMPIPVHPATHPMLKVKTPDTFIPSVFRAPAANAPAPAPVMQTGVATASPVVINLDQPASTPRVQGYLSPTFAPGYQPSYVRPSSPSGTDLTYRDPEEVEQVESRPATPVALVPEAAVIPAEVDEPVTNETSGLPPAESRNAEVQSAPSMESSTGGFTLPPLGFNPDSDLLRDLWPRVAHELRNLMQRVELAPVTPPAQSSEQVPKAEPALAAQSVPQTANVDQDTIMQDPVVDAAQVTAAATAPSGVMSGPVSDVCPSALTTSLSSLDAAAKVDESPAPRTIAEEPAGMPLSAYPDALMASFLADTTVPDGQVFPPGAEFVKAWRMVNVGRDWPETAELVYIAGERFGAKQHFRVGHLGTGKEMDVWTGELKAPEIPGRYVGYWRLADGQGTLFGHSLWIDITVAETSHQSDGSSASQSLSSSAVIMPVPASVRSVPVDGNEPASPAVTAPSAHAAVEVASEAGSDNSSISLISVPSSEDDDDVAVWEDSRSHMESSTSPRVPSRPSGLDYVVLYDESSSDEE